MKYLIIIEKTKTGYSAYSPDLPGCVSTGKTIEETESNMHEAIEFHLGGIKKEGLEIPPASTHVTFHEVGVQD
jgi:predicted RNase H-like HicB family nuclease